MAISITTLSGGNTPADGSDPRTFPAIWNATASDLEGLSVDVDDLSTDVDGKANIVNTDSDAGKTIYVGATNPNDSYSLVAGDVWIEVPA
jgi:hypothetical protein